MNVNGEVFLLDALRRRLATRDVGGLVQLSGGASRETWAFVADGRRLILQQDRPGGLRRASTVCEVAAIRAAERAGVPVARVVASGHDWFVTEAVDGETIARRILRDHNLRVARHRFVSDMANAAARIHSVDADAVPGLPEESLDGWRQELDAYGEARPTFELAFRWLERNSPAGRRQLVHGDFRLGNVIVAQDGVRAVLDWEMAHAGDPVEDLGYLCVRSWRFGGSLPVAGLGERDDLLQAYEAGGGRHVTRAELHRAEVWGTMRWGVIALRQVHAHLSGTQRSIELAAIGRRICEIEHDLLVLLEASV